MMFLFSGFLSYPEGPHHSKQTTATQNIVNYYAVVFSLQPPESLRPGRFLRKKNACTFKIQEIGICPGEVAIANHCPIANSLQAVD